jgi:PleD family two-component response regulator
MGISSGTPDRPEDLNRLLALADEALYAAKQNGRDRAEWRSLVRGEPGPAASR